jgi:hypothetical protein
MMPLGVYASFPNSLFVGIRKSGENLVTGNTVLARDGERASERPVPITLIQMTLRITKEHWDTNPKAHVPSGTGRSTNRLSARR